MNEDQKLAKYFRVDFRLHKEVYGVSQQRQLAALKLALQQETARHEAEIYRLPPEEVQQKLIERSRLEAEQAHLASIDPLTKVYNRRHFFDLARLEFEQAVRYHHPLTVLILDVDYFAKINDRFGHIGGDQVLAELAVYLSNTLRKSDILGRYKGEEFVALLVNTNPAQGLLAARRICVGVSKQPFQTPNDPASVTISVGAASLAKGQGSLDELVDRAEQAMFLAKQAGRNQVRVVAIQTRPMA